ncbi:sigma-70 family RNA polymerase sigma factor [Sediminibacterium sp.]|uniref:RNA polymerase sigma factor n=1 Tax=Sediminibacterium sp. TaxID=1917865 RepID=UPI0025DA5BE2|nr:sigma-70 family RNA polymerase sigma factor [Sediminibacterium sp.]MBT9484867.1 sigma-70 family RNA polymerase sigma factor [Sediminibacterium sp.]
MIQQTFKHITDIELLKKFQTDQNKEWLGILLQRYTMLLLGVCMKYLKNEEEAKDAVQQIFLKALSELEKYHVDYPKSWLYKIACNYCLMKLRDQKTYLSIDNETILAETIEQDNTSIIEKEINLNLLEAAIKELNKEQKTCITLFYLQKKSYQQISSITGLSLLQVKSSIQNGKRNLKILMEKKQSF